MNIMVTMTMIFMMTVVAACLFESQTLCDEDKEEDLGQHVAGWDYSGGMMTPTLTMLFILSK